VNYGDEVTSPDGPLKQPAHSKHRRDDQAPRN
jgi:hypothetical protein